jgi:RNA polymerase sigma factor (sigma-70 family)
VTEEEIPVIFHAHVRTLARKVAWKWRNKVPAADLAQVAMLAGVLAFRSFEPGHGAVVETWIKTKMGYAVLDCVREQLHTRSPKSTYKTDALEPNAERKLPALTEWPGIDARLDIPAALSRLDPRAREIIERRYLREEPQAQIAASLGISFSRVSQIEAAACVKMRRAFLLKAA